MNEIVSAWTPLIVAVLASGTALASGIGPAVRYARLEKLVAARSERGQDEKVDLLIDVLASGLIVEENSFQQRTRFWWAVWTGVILVGAASALLVGLGVWQLVGVDNDAFRLAGVIASLIALPLFARAVWALFRPRPQTLLVPHLGSVDRVQPAARAAQPATRTPSWLRRTFVSIWSTMRDELR